MLLINHFFKRKHVLILQFSQHIYAEQHFNIMDKTIEVIIREINHQRNREPSSAKTIASCKNVVQENKCGERCYHNPKILTNYLYSNRCNHTDYLWTLTYKLIPLERTFGQ